MSAFAWREWGRAGGRERVENMMTTTMTATMATMIRRNGRHSTSSLCRHVSNQEELTAAAKAALAIYPDLLAEVLKAARVEYVLYDHETHEGVVM